MDRVSEVFSLLLVVILVVSSLMILPINAQTTSKPSIPEFTLKFFDYGDYPSIEITIRNQPYISTVNGTPAKLYYNFRTKNHEATHWRTQYDYSPNSLPLQRTSNYSTLFFQPDYYSGNKVDFQVEALLGYYDYVYIPDHPFIPPSKVFETQSSGWSLTQTFTMPDTPTPNPTLNPTQTNKTTIYLSTETLLAIIAAIAIIALSIAVGTLLLHIKQHASNQ